MRTPGLLRLCLHMSTEITFGALFGAFSQCTQVGVYLTPIEEASRLETHLLLVLLQQLNQIPAQWSQVPWLCSHDMWHWSLVKKEKDVPGSSRPVRPMRWQYCLKN